MYSRKYMTETILKICDHFELVAYECFNIDYETLEFKIEDRYRNVICTIIIDQDHFNKNTLDKIWDVFSKTISTKTEERHVIGWRPILEYSREKYDWVLVKYFDGPYECVPEVAEMRVDGKWYNRVGALIPDIFVVKYFFDMQQLDKEV